MAVALDASLDLGSVSASSLTAAFTVGAGTDRILFVGVSASTDLVTGVTYNGVAMTLVGKKNISSGGQGYLFVLVNPASGSNNVAISASGSTTITGMAVSYTGAKQTGQPDNHNEAQGIGIGDGSWTGTSLTTVAANCWGVGFFIISGGGTPAAQNGTHQLRVAAGRGLVDWETVIAAGGTLSLTMNQVGSGQQNWAYMIASIASDGLGSSVSPSASRSPSASTSPSISPSSSLSPSASLSPSSSISSSVSASVSPSSSVSASVSPSASTSPSASASPSNSGGGLLMMGIGS